MRGCRPAASPTKTNIENTMKKTRLVSIPKDIPERLLPLLSGAPVWDSSCSPEARVLFFERDGGIYLKSAEAGTLSREAEMTRFFHLRGMGTEVLDYFSEGGKDWFLTAAVKGEDLTHDFYTSDPKRLSDTLAERLRLLHECSTEGCPVSDHTSEYLARVEENYRTGNYDSSHFPDSFGYTSAKEAWEVLEKNRHLLKSDTLLHGDYCLPNVMYNGWEFSSFIDVGNGGIGDRHVDLFWGAWTLSFNLHTDAYRDRFFDAYGRDRIDEELLRTVAAAEVFG